MFLVNPATQFIYHGGQSGGRGLSPRVWAHLEGQAMSPDGASNVYGLFDDFLSFGSVTVTTAAGQLQPPNGYFAYIEDDATVGAVKNIATANGGVIQLLTSTDAADGDNHDTVLTTGGNVGTLGVISDTAGADKLLIFEARVKFASVTNGDGSVFIGLTEEGCAAQNGVITDDSGHTLAAKDLIGFFVSEADNDALKFVYKKGSGALQTVLTYGTALVADTWYKLGFVYDPRSIPSKRIKVYVNNDEQSTYVTATQIAAATFPDGEELAMTLAIKGSANNDPQSFYADWACFAQAG